MNIHALALGLLASALALLQIAGWCALGAVFVRGVSPASLALPTALLIGSALTSFVYAVLSAAGQVELAIALCVGASLLALLVRGRFVLARARELAGVVARVCQGRRWLALGMAGIGAAAWLLSIVPPRDADVMRYHLAHVRQILEDGAWLAIADYCYALPFGWTISYLPFEAIGLPQGAHLLNWVLWVVTLACLLDMGLRMAPRWPLAVVGLCGVFALQPFILKMSTTGHADAYLLIEVLTVVGWLLRGPRQRPADFALLGFVAWIGMQGRYQAAAVALSTGVVLLFFLARRQLELRALFACTLGSIAALLLSSPFYVMNALAFGNPVWPLFTRVLGSHAGYADQIADHFDTVFTGRFDIPTVAAGARALVLSPEVFPVPFLAVFFLIASALRRSAAATTLAVFLGASLGFWMLTNPNLYSRYSLSLVPPAIVGWFAILAALPELSPRLRRLAGVGFAGMLLGMFAICGLYSRDSFAYLLTSDARSYHAYTWYYDVFEWANRSTPEDARFLVVVDSGTTYYLDRPYRRADPCLSGVIDWPRVQSAKDLMQVLEVGGYSYLLYHERDWSECPGGAQMEAAIRAAQEEGLLLPVERFEIQLGTSRLLRKTQASSALILAPRPSAPGH